MSHAVNKDDFNRLMAEYATFLEGELAKAEAEKSAIAKEAKIKVPEALPETYGINQ